MPLSHIQMTRTRLGLLLASGLALACLLAAASTAEAASITLYKNSLQSSAARKNIKQYSGKDKCGTSGTKSFRVEVGKRTRECAFRVPYAGRNVGISVTARLFKSTPKKVRAQAYLSVSIRQDADGSRYQLCVFPSGKRFQLRKIFPNGKIQDLDHGKAGGKAGGFGDANRISLRAYNSNSGAAGIVASVNGHRLAAVTDPRGNELEGQDTTFSMGSKKSARGAKGSFVKLVGTAPDPF